VTREDDDDDDDDNIKWEQAPTQYKVTRLYQVMKTKSQKSAGHVAWVGETRNVCKFRRQGQDMRYLEMAKGELKSCYWLELSSWKYSLSLS
jgi:hypothetical protein